MSLTGLMGSFPHPGALMLFSECGEQPFITETNSGWKQQARLEIFWCVVLKLLLKIFFITSILHFRLMVNSIWKRKVENVLIHQQEYKLQLFHPGKWLTVQELTDAVFIALCYTTLKNVPSHEPQNRQRMNSKLSAVKQSSCRCYFNSIMEQGKWKRSFLLKYSCNIWGMIKIFESTVIVEVQVELRQKCANQVRDIEA